MAIARASPKSCRYDEYVEAVCNVGEQNADQQAIFCNCAKSASVAGSRAVNQKNLRKIGAKKGAIASTKKSKRKAN
ncbi:hypothetical protein ACV229_01050 [Burkholderia sp. MR1-5-21]